MKNAAVVEKDHSKYLEIFSGNTFVVEFIFVRGANKKF